MRGLNQPDVDRGAVAVLFALVLVVLLGFVGAGVDVASAYAKTQEVQNGADAAALAAAQQCASEGCAGNDALALEMARGNIRLEVASVATAVDYPATNQVRVVAQGDHQNYFLGLFGQPSFRVEEEATASWGTPRSGPAMMPLAISQCSFEEMLGDPLLNVPVEINIPKNNEGINSVTECDWHADYPAGGFGWLSTGGTCETEVAVDQWIATEPGLSQPAGCDLSQFIGEVVLLPIFDDDAGNGSWASVHIDRFAAFEVLGITIQTGNQTWGERCAPNPGADYMKTCIRGTFIEYVSMEDGYESGDPDTEVTVVTLID